MLHPHLGERPGATLIKTGSWPEEGAKWSLYLATRLPQEAVITVAAGLAIRNLDTREAMLTFNVSKFKDRPGQAARTRMWELPGGHVEPERQETWPQAFRRELLEEVGVHVPEDQSLPVFAFRLVTNPPGAAEPPLACTAYTWTTIDRDPSMPTDPRKPIPGTFMHSAMEQLAEEGLMHPDELLLAGEGFNAALRARMGGGTTWW